jgi:hypothetical protein
MLCNLARKILKAISVMLSGSDPKAAAEIETFAAKLLRISATANIGPAQIQSIAGALPAFPQSQGMAIPPPVGGTAGMAGPLSGLAPGGAPPPLGG